MFLCLEDLRSEQLTDSSHIHCYSTSLVIATSPASQRYLPGCLDARVRRYCRGIANLDIPKRSRYTGRYLQDHCSACDLAIPLSNMLILFLACRSGSAVLQAVM